MNSLNVWVFFSHLTDKRADKLRVYNFSRVGADREWLQGLLLNDSSTDSNSDESVTEEEIRREMKFHLLRKKYRKRFYLKNDVSVRSLLQLGCAFELFVTDVSVCVESAV